MKKYLLGLSLLSAALPATANAAVSPQTADFGKFYVGVGAGIVVPQGTDISASGTVTGSGTLNYKDSAGIMGLAGYHFSDYLAGEAELGYSSLDYDNVSGTLTAGSLGTGSGSIGINGHTNAFVGLANAIVSPFGKTLGIVPYIGGGIGFASTSSKINSLSFGGATANVDSSNSETNLALDGIVGVDVPVADGFALGARYQYLWVNTDQTTSGTAISSSQGNFGASIITAQATYKF